MSSLVNTSVTVAEVERWLHALYIGDETACLRKEERQKAIQIAAILREVALAANRLSQRSRLTLVDVAAGKSYLGLLAAKLLFEPSGRDASVVTLEREPRRVAISRSALSRLGTKVPVECRMADAIDAAAWPDAPAIVVALHACGRAADDIIDRAAGSRARTLLLVPCCTSRAVASLAQAETLARELGIPRQAPVRRRFLQALVDADRTRRLEGLGYRTEVVEFVGATVTPHNLLWRAVGRFDA
ncbi:MAG: methyltransferase [Vicinamibacterales bacterium]